MSAAAATALASAGSAATVSAAAATALVSAGSAATGWVGSQGFVSVSLSLCSCMRVSVGRLLDWLPTSSIVLHIRLGAPGHPHRPVG